MHTPKECHAISKLLEPLNNKHIKANQSQPHDELTVMTFTEERCFLANACVKLGFSFAFVGDDMDPSLGCSSVLGVMEDANGGDFGFSEINHIGDCDCPAGRSLLSIVAGELRHSGLYDEMQTITYQNRTSVRDNVLNGTIHNNVEIFEECIPESCWHLTNSQSQPMIMFFILDGLTMSCSIQRMAKK